MCISKIFISPVPLLDLLNIFFVSNILKFGFKMPRCRFFSIYLTWCSLEHLGFVSVKNFNKFLASITLNISFYFSSSSGISIICIFHHLYVLAFLDTMFYLFHSFLFFSFLLHFTLNFNFLLLYLWFTVFLTIQFTSEPIKGNLHFCYIVFNFFNDILFKFASLHFYYPYILAYYQLFTLEHL